MVFEFVTKINTGDDGQEYENLSPDFKAMDVDEAVTVTPIEVLKEGTASKDGRSWQWKLYKMMVNGEECGGFAPVSWMNEDFDLNLGTEMVLTRYMDKKKSKLFFKISGGVKPQKKKTAMKPKLGAKPFEFMKGSLKDAEGTYDERDAIQVLKEDGKFDIQKEYENMWVDYGSTKERGIEVFNHRGEING